MLLLHLQHDGENEGSVSRAMTMVGGFFDHLTSARTTSSQFPSMLNSRVPPFIHSTQPFTLAALVSPCRLARGSSLVWVDRHWVYTMRSNAPVQRTRLVCTVRLLSTLSEEEHLYVYRNSIVNSILLAFS